MIRIFINGVERPEIDPAVGAKLEMTANHRTDSSLTVRVPVDADPVQPADFITIMDGDTKLFSGVISGIDQQVMGGATDGLDARIYALTMASNVDTLATTLVDLPFVAGETAQEILWGDNLDAPAWQASIFRVRLFPLGITKGVIEGLDNVILSENATLWGSYIADVLDTICDAAGCWWELTPDSVLNIRRSDSTPGNPPFALDESAPIYDLDPSDDAYTMYSAVRVVGGNGKGTQISAGQFEGSAGHPGGVIGIASYATDKIVLTKPIYSLIALTVYNPASGYYESPKTGVRGIDDNDSTVQVYWSNEGAELEAANGYAFPAQSESSFWECDYYPYIPIVVRLVDANLQTQLQARRGGTGIVEYILKDDSITDYPTAAVSGKAFLHANAKPASTLVFHTQTAGIQVGMVFSGASIPYYGISGDYAVGSVSATIQGTQGGALWWEYEVVVSTVPYRDPTQALLFSVRKIMLKLGDDVPASDGVNVDNQISITTGLEIRAIHPPTWEELDAAGKTWAELDAAGKAWAELENTVEEWNYMGNYLTTAFKQTLAALLAGQITSLSDQKINQAFVVYTNGSGTSSWQPSDTGLQILGNQILDVYTLPEDKRGQITEIRFGTGAYEGGYIAAVPVNVDKQDGNPLGDYILVIAATHTIV